MLSKTEGRTQKQPGNGREPEHDSWCYTVTAGKCLCRHLKQGVVVLFLVYVVVETQKNKVSRVSSSQAPMDEQDERQGNVNLNWEIIKQPLKKVRIRYVR